MTKEFMKQAIQMLIKRGVATEEDFSESNVTEEDIKVFEDTYDITMCGFCTDICVIANVLITQAEFENEIPIVVIEDGCAGTSPEKHKAALDVMRSCQIDVVNHNDIEVLPVVFSKEWINDKAKDNFI